MTSTPYELGRGPLLRCALLRLTAEDHVLLVGMHHLVADGWSLGIFLRELATGYEALCASRQPELPELSIQYVDFAGWQRRRSASWSAEIRQLGAKLAGPPLELPTDRPRRAEQTFRGRRRSFAVNSVVATKLRGLSQELGVTLFPVLLAGLDTLLLRYSGQTDLLVGSAISCRTRPEIEQLIGLFTNLLPLRVDASGNPSFSELVRRAANVCVQAYAHQEIPLDRILEDLPAERSLSRVSVFPFVFVFQNDPQLASALWGRRFAGLEMEAMELESQGAKFDLELWVWDTGRELHGWLGYNIDLFDDGTALRLLEDYQALLAAAVESPGKPILDLSEPSGSRPPPSATGRFADDEFDFGATEPTVRDRNQT